jgi:hypothetical protein
MGLFGRKRKDLVYEGLAGSAVIRAAEQTRPDRQDEYTSLSDLGLGHVGYRMELEVQLDDGREPYTVQGKFKVPTKLDGVVDVGSTIPIYTDPDDLERIEFNWDRFVAEGGGPPTRAEIVDQAHESFPADSRKMMIDGWVTATQGGAMTREAFDESLDGMVQSGVLNAEEAAAARARLGGS